MDILKIPTEKLKPSKYNPRKDLKPGDPEYEKLRRSIEEFGYVEPVIWNKRTGNIERLFPLFIQINYNTVDLLVPQSCKYFITLMSADNVPGAFIPYDRLYIPKLFNRPT